MVMDANLGGRRERERRRRRGEDSGNEQRPMGVSGITKYGNRTVGEEGSR